MSTDYLKRDFRTPKTLALAPLASPPRPFHYTISYRAVAPVAMICDVLLISLVSVLSGVGYHFGTVGSTGDVTQFLGFAAIVAVLFITIGKSRDIYKLSELLNLRSQIRKVATTWAAVFLFLTAIAFVMKVGGSFSRGVVLLFAGSGLMALVAARVAWRLFLADGLAVRRFSNRKIALLTQQVPAEARVLLTALNRHGFQPTFQFEFPGDLNKVERRKEVIAQLISSLRGSDIEEIVVSASLDQWPELSSVLSELRVLPIPVNLIPIGPLSELFRLPSHTIGSTVNIELQRGPRTLFERAIKRAFDIIVASTALLMLLPLFLMTALAIKMDSPGPIIFRQRRRGFNGRPFQILKFRTMTVLEDDEHVVQATLNDVRITRIGAWLRRTSIDELPQLINVLQGSMSIVGPRPHAMAHDNKFDKIIGNYAFRHHVKPGITGWAQVNGHRGQTPTIADIKYRITLDLWYIDNWSLAVDFKILFLTIAELIFSKNAY
jgi:putative colanic acid biosynthesis UDP-glucose lipid carrier transferase